MVIERVHDAEHSIIEIIHIQTKAEIDSIDVPEEDVFKEGIKAVKDELLTYFPQYSLVFAAKNREYKEDKYLGLYMEYVARGVLYF